MGLLVERLAFRVDDMQGSITLHPNGAEPATVGRVKRAEPSEVPRPTWEVHSCQLGNLTRLVPIPILFIGKEYKIGLRFWDTKWTD